MGVRTGMIGSPSRPGWWSPPAAVTTTTTCGGPRRWPPRDGRRVRTRRRWPRPPPTVRDDDGGRRRASDCELEEPLTIGYAADLGDFGGFADVPGSEAAGVQVELLNEAGGVGGQDVEYVVKELPVDPSGAQRAAQELLDEGVDAIIAPPFSYNGVPLIETVDGAGADHLQRLDRPGAWPTRRGAPS